MSGSLLTLADGGSVELDEKGYLLDWLKWSPGVTESMAATDGIALTDEHWVVLKLFRTYFGEHEIEPPMRALVRMTRKALGDDKGTSRFLYRLFPDGPGTQGCRYAGLPRPVSCV